MENPAPYIISTTAILISLLFFGFIFYMYITWKEDFEILSKRKKELQAKLDEHNKIGIWYYRNLIWKCGEQGAYLILMTKDHNQNIKRKKKI